MKKRISLLVVALALAAPMTLGVQKKPTVAPDFKAVGSDGKTYTLKSITENKPVYLYFIKRTCPVNAGAIQHFKSIQQAYKDKVNFVGVFDGDKELFDKWQKNFKVKFPVLLDPSLNIIRAYQAGASPAVAIVGVDQKVSAFQRGYSEQTLKDLNKRIAKETGSKEIKLVFKDAPQEVAFG